MNDPKNIRQKIVFIVIDKSFRLESDEVLIATADSFALRV